MSKNKETIVYKGKILAHIFRSGLGSKGTTFFTPPRYTLQLGILTHPKGSKLRDHSHNPKLKYNVDTTQEFLYIEKGRVSVTFYSEDWKKIAQRILKKGDFMLHVSGGHGFEILEDSKMIEIKQGPFPGDKKEKIYKDNDKNTSK